MWDEKYLLVSNFSPLLEYILRSRRGFWLDEAPTLVERCLLWTGAKQCPDIFRRAFYDCSVASFAVRVVTWVDRSAIVFINSATDFLLACVAVARFAIAMMWSCYISVIHRRIGLYGLHIGCIPLGLRSTGLSLCFHKRCCKVSLEIAPVLIEPRFAGPFLTIILI